MFGDLEEALNSMLVPEHAPYYGLQPGSGGDLFRDPVEGLNLGILNISISDEETSEESVGERRLAPPSVSLRNRSKKLLTRIRNDYIDSLSYHEDSDIVTQHRPKEYNFATYPMPGVKELGEKRKNRAHRKREEKFVNHHCEDDEKCEEKCKYQYKKGYKGIFHHFQDLKDVYRFEDECKCRQRRKESKGSKSIAYPYQVDEEAKKPNERCKCQYMTKDGINQEASLSVTLPCCGKQHQVSLTLGCNKDKTHSGRLQEDSNDCPSITACRCGSGSCRGGKDDVSLSVRVPCCGKDHNVNLSVDCSSHCQASECKELVRWNEEESRNARENGKLKLTIDVPWSDGKEINVRTVMSSSIEPAIARNQGANVYFASKEITHEKQMMDEMEPNLYKHHRNRSIEAGKETEPTINREEGNVCKRDGNEAELNRFQHESKWIDEGEDTELKECKEQKNISIGKGKEREQNASTDEEDEIKLTQYKPRQKNIRIGKGKERQQNDSTDEEDEIELTQYKPKNESFEMEKETEPHLYKRQSVTSETYSYTDLNTAERKHRVNIVKKLKQYRPSKVLANAVLRYESNRRLSQIDDGNFSDTALGQKKSRDPNSWKKKLRRICHVYVPDDLEEPPFQYIPEVLPTSATIKGGVPPLQESLMLLAEGLDAGSLVAQFEQLYRRKPGLTVTEARRQENEKKNRYRDISPYDTTRVILTSTPSGNYINASYVNMEVQGSGIINRYIASQGPLAGTCTDFWHMVWEQQSTLIVMLTTVVEQGRVKCHRYWPRLYETVDFGILQVTCNKEDETPGFAFREFTLINTETQEERHITHMQYLAWPDHGVPDDSTEFLNFVTQVRKARVGMVEPTIVHCSAGIGRTGVLILMETAQCLIEANEPIYPLDIVKAMRDQRAMMIQTASQFRFVCEAIHRVYQEELVKPLAEYQQR